jgi:hypothetical protein
MILIRSVKAIVLAGTVVGATLIAAPQASALEFSIPMELSPYEIAFQVTDGTVSLSGTSCKNEIPSADGISFSDSPDGNPCTSVHDRSEIQAADLRSFKITIESVLR